MNLKPSETLTSAQVTKGLDLVVQDGLAAEAMTTLTGGTFLVAMALKLGASNFQIGLFAALPTLASIFQLFSIWLVQKYNNRRAVAVVSNIFARFPLLVIGLLPFLFTTGTSIQALLFLLFFHYFFGSVAGSSWNSWMKDLVPENKLGTYFSHRSRLTQTLNVVLSLLLALVLDYIKKAAPQHELLTYACMFVGGGVMGLLGTYVLSKVPEPKTYMAKQNLFRLFSKPLKDRNFRNLLLFNSFWSFALSLATPFFSVFMMKTIGLPLSYIIGFGILSQLASILAIKVWGRYSDRYSNKTIISIAAPVYIACIIAWSFVGMHSSHTLTIAFIGLINILSGAATSGINLAISNIGIKLAPKDEAIVYLSAKSVIVAFVSTLGPLAGGWLADFFATRSFAWKIQWHGVHGLSVLHLMELHGWTFLFVIGGLLAIAALKTLNNVKEEGEVQKDLAVAEMRVVFRSKLKEKINKRGVLSILLFPVLYPVVLKNKVVNRFERKVVNMRNWEDAVAERRA